MPVDVDWRLGVMPNVGGNALAAFQQGAKVGEEIRRRKALKAFSEHPDDPHSLNALIAADPQTGFRAAEFQREQAKAKREQDYGAAVGDYLTTGGGAAMMGGGTTPPPSGESLSFNQPSHMPNGGNGAVPPSRSVAATAPGPNFPAGAPQGMNALAAFATPQGHWPSPDQAPQLPDSRQAQQPAAQAQPDPDLAALGTPRTSADHAFLRMVKADPLKALKFRSELRDNFVKTIKDTREVYRFGIERLSQANDEPTYQAVLAELHPMTQAIGGNLLDHVPPHYPGPEGMHELLTKALDAKDQVSSFMQQANIDDDNERADRNTDSIIADRSARRGEVRRYHDQQSSNTRRGQDVRSRDTRRGQDSRGSRSLGLVQVKSRAEAEALPSGTKFRDPHGVVRTRP